MFAIEVAEDHLDEVSRSMYHHLKVLIEERDGYVEVMTYPEETFAAPGIGFTNNLF